MYAPLAPQAQHRIRQSLRAALPGVGSAHLAEALAAALGFRTSVALKTRSMEALPGASADADPQTFSDRLASLGYAVPVEAAAALLQGAIKAEERSDEMARAIFSRLVSNAVSQNMLDMRIMTKGSNTILQQRFEGQASFDEPLALEVGGRIIPAVRAMCTNNQVAGPFMRTTVLRERLELTDKLIGLHLQFGATPDGPYLLINPMRLN